MSVGLHIMRPTSIVVAGAGSSASIRADGGVDFASATSLSLNGVFTAAYDNYIINMSGVTSAGDLAIQFRLRSSGTDATGTDYTFQRLIAGSTSVAGSRSTSQNYGVLGFWSPSLKNGDTAYVYGPYLAQPTASRNVNVDTSGNAYILDYATTHGLSSSYDGLTLLVGANNITGMITVYGYAQ